MLLARRLVAKELGTFSAHAQLARPGRRAFSATTAAWQAGDAPPKAAIMVVGNEVLSGKIQDTNSVWLGTHKDICCTASSAAPATAVAAAAAHA